MIFALLNSYTATFIRSQIDNNIRLSSIYITIDSSVQESIVTGDFSGADEILIPYDNTQSFDAHFNATVSGSPDPILITVDNKPITKNFINRQQSWFWEPDYFTQNCSAFVDVHDGSVLEFDCGSLHREWTFRCQSK